MVSWSAVSQSLSIVLITHNEEHNLPRTLASVAELVKQTSGEIIVLDSGSTDRTVEVAKSLGAKVFLEEWKGYAAQKNSAIDKASRDWILSLDADEEVDAELAHQIRAVLDGDWTQVAGDGQNAESQTEVARGKRPEVHGFWMARRNYFLGRWIRHGGFYPDRKLRLFRRGYGEFQPSPVHETVKVSGPTYKLRRGTLLHHAYPSLQSYIGHMNRYSTLGAEAAMTERRHGFSLWNIVVRPWATFIYNYFFRLGFLDGKEGLLLHLYHAVYVSWKYAKAWEFSESGHRRSGHRAIE